MAAKSSGHGSGSVKGRRSGGKSQAKPGASVTRKVTSGPGKGDTVQFRANSAGSQEPGKLKPRRVIKDVAPLRTQKTLARGKKPKK